MSPRFAALGLAGATACLMAGAACAAEPRDPTRPPREARAALPAGAASAVANVRELDRLVAIRQDSTRRWQALFGERWLGVGDRLDKFSVEAIDDNTVQLIEGRNRRLLTLLPALKRADPTRQTSADVAQARSDAPPLNRPSAMPTP